MTDAQQSKHEPNLLDEIDGLHATIANGEKSVREEVAQGLRALQQLAEGLADELGKAQARTFTVKTAAGRELAVSDRDALVLFAASVKCGFARGAVKLPLQSGMTEELRMVDLLQLSDAILAATAPPPATRPTTVEGLET